MIHDKASFQIPDAMLSLYTLEQLAFIDIETTGLSSQYHQIINLGILTYNKKWHFNQYWASTLDEERLLLESFLELDNPNSLLICYNGKVFDMPFITNRLIYHRLIHTSFSDRTLDFIYLGRAYAKRNHLSSYKLTALETHFNLNRDADISGVDVIQAFHAYRKTQDSRYKKAILQHNRLDVERMPYLLYLLSQAMPAELSHCIPIIITFKGGILRLHSKVIKEDLLIEGTISPIVSTPIHLYQGYQIQIEGQKVRISLPIIKSTIDDHLFIRIDWNQMFGANDFLSLSTEEQLLTVVQVDGLLYLKHIQYIIKDLIFGSYGSNLF